MALPERDRKMFSLGMLSMAGLLVAANAVYWFISVAGPTTVSMGRTVAVAAQLLGGLVVAGVAWVSARKRGKMV